MTGRKWFVVVASLIGINVVLALLSTIGGGTPGGPPSSAYATGVDGVGAYAELLRRSGHSVELAREPVEKQQLGAADTLVMLDTPGVTAEDVARLRSFVGAGGRVVVGGFPGRWLERVEPSAPTWIATKPATAHVLAPTAEVEGVVAAEPRFGGAWTSEGPALPLLSAAEGHTLLSIIRSGKGRIVLLADASPLTNGSLDEADNAALGLGLVGHGAGRVVFAESYHGYGERSGAGAIPSRWWVALALGLLATVTLMLARGRRLGPPEPDERALAPPRALYIEALAASLARRRDRSAAAKALQARMHETRAAGFVAAPAPSQPQPSTVAAFDDASLIEVGAVFANNERSTRRDR